MKPERKRLSAWTKNECGEKRGPGDVSRQQSCQLLMKLTNLVEWQLRLPVKQPHAQLRLSVRFFPPCCQVLALPKAGARVACFSR